MQSTGRVKAIEMRIVYIIFTVLVLVWALFFLKGVRTTMLSVLRRLFG